MSNCPKCNHKLPFLKVGLLSNASNGINCKICYTNLKANGLQLSIIGASGASIGVFLLNWVYIMYRNQLEYWFIGVLVVIIFFIGVIYLQNKTLKLYVDDKPKNIINLKTDNDTFNQVIPNKFEDPIEHLKYIYRDYSEVKLKKIVSGSGYRHEAIAAASQLLKEKFKQ